MSDAMHVSVQGVRGVRGGHGVCGVSGAGKVNGVHAARDVHAAQAVRSRHVRTKLTVRGKIVVACFVAAVSWGAFSLAYDNSAESAEGATEVVNYTVRPGDTLWSYAQSITPAGGDVSESVDELMDLNNLDSASLTPGQTIVVPAE